MSKPKEVYNIIRDRSKLEHYVNNFLYPSKEGEGYYITLLSRKKYGGDESLLYRNVVNHKHLINVIERLEVPINSYIDRSDNPISEDSLAMYINPTPRSYEKALYRLGKQLWKQAESGSFSSSILTKCKDTIQGASSKKLFSHYDFDGELDPQELYETFIRYLPHQVIHFLKTKGGYHVFVDIKKLKKFQEWEYEKSWYPKLMNCFEKKLDGEKDQLMPVPGCTQGGFVPHFIDLI